MAHAFHRLFERCDWRGTRRKFIIGTSAAAVLANIAQASASENESPAAADDGQAIDFSSSYLSCSPTGSGIFVRIQLECIGRLSELASGESVEFAMGVMAKTGLSPIANTGKIAPGYDYTVIFSKTHVFTKRSHSSSYLNNPTVLEHKDFGSADRHLRRKSAKRLKTVDEVREAIKSWRRISARTVFASVDGGRQYSLEYPVKWADYGLDGKAFRIETGPVVLLDPNKARVESVPEFDDFQWAHFDFHSFDQLRCLLEAPTSILDDLTFMPPAEHGREKRDTPAITEAQVKALREALSAKHGVSLPPDAINNLLSTDHYSRSSDVSVMHELFELED